MTEPKPSKDLLTALESEVYGEASFRSAYYVCFGAKKRKAEALWKLETQTRERIMAYYEENNLATPKLRLALIKGSIIGLIFPLFPWKLIQHIILKETEHYLTVFRRLESQADDNDKPLFRYLVDHEIAIRRFAEMELANKPEEAYYAIANLLA